ncbi:hypothetical protein FACS189418_0860 [Clostridia bacterium]|nr:hypothetical protein FACS189418_0860 [Clostridia bacterium]
MTERKSKMSQMMSALFIPIAIAIVIYLFMYSGAIFFLDHTTYGRVISLMISSNENTAKSGDNLEELPNITLNETEEEDGQIQETSEEFFNTSVTIPKYGEEYGMLIGQSIGMKIPLMMGDSEAQLKRGAGQYLGSFLPGYGGTILAAGHNITHFFSLSKIREKDILEIDTSYGQFQYEVRKIQVHAYNDPKAYDLSQQDEEILVLYTCYPFEVMSSLKTDRLFVYAQKIKGPKVVW